MARQYVLEKKLSEYIFLFISMLGRNALFKCIDLIFAKLLDVRDDESQA
jgi:hypothetical protein